MRRRLEQCVGLSFEVTRENEQRAAIDVGPRVVDEAQEVDAIGEAEASCHLLRHVHVAAADPAQASRPAEIDEHVYRSEQRRRVLLRTNRLNREEVFALAIDHRRG